MFNSHQKPTGTQYTMTVALLIAAVIISPTVLILSSPIGYVSAALALVFSMSCIAFAWVNWTKYSQLTIPSIETPPARAK
jgi:hypothetical protein